MSVIQILVIIFGLLNLAFAGSLYAHSNRSTTVTFYALISVFASLWSLSTVMTEESVSTTFLHLALSGHYIFGYLAYLSFFWFALFFPFRSKAGAFWAQAVTVLSIAFVLLIPVTTVVFSLQPGSSLGERIVFNYAGYSAFVAMLAFVFVVGLLILLTKLHSQTGRESLKALTRYQIYFVVLSNFIAGSLGIILNLILPLYGNFFFFYINPIFVSTALIGIGFYNLIKNHLFHAKLVLTEFFIAGIWIISLARLVASNGQNDLFINGVIVIAWTIFGAFLIRGVLRERTAREEVEKLAAQFEGANEAVYAHSRELAHLKKELESANEKLKEVDHLKSEFLSIASHQLRAPITAIRGYTSLILEGDYGAMPEKMRDPLERIAESSHDMASAIEDYLNISRIEQGSMKYEKSSFDLTDLAQKTVAELQPVARRRGLALSFDAGAATPVIADVGKIKQVLSNLVDNAIKYTEKGSITVSVTTENGKARVTVADTGTGIAKDEINGLFEKFKRARGANKINTTGTGLGLYVAKQLVEGHGGRVWAESEGLGLGSRFIVELPA